MVCFLRVSHGRTPTSAGGARHRERRVGAISGEDLPACYLKDRSPSVHAGGCGALGSNPQTAYKKAVSSTIRTPSSAPKTADAATFPIRPQSRRRARRQDAALTWQPLQREHKGRPRRPDLSCSQRGLAVTRGNCRPERLFSHLPTQTAQQSPGSRSSSFAVF